MTNDGAQTLLTLLGGLVAVTAFMGTCLTIAVQRRKLVIVDTAWGLGFVVIATVAAFISLGGDAAGPVPWILFAMVALWGLRLAWHLQTRNARLPEDPRYVDLIERSSGTFGQIALRKVFAPQGITMWLVATPVMIGVNNTDPIIWLTVAGVIVWATGLFFEAVGDAQLARFKRVPANSGQLMDQGLWRYTRHPNYFGDACVWWGIWVVAASSWLGVATIIGPIAMTVFLTQVTGKALNEKGMSTSKPGYADYVARTSGFVPLPPKR